MNEKYPVVIDTNVIISSLWGGNPVKVMELWDKNRFIALISREILDEYLDVLSRFRPADEDLEQFIMLFMNRNKSQIIKTKSKINAIKTDPADNKFLECAVDGGARFIVSGDTHLLALKEHKKIRILSPAEFVKLF
jgi:putative PIN family toxin of toxin-antitoxin system